jgi:hypothetical protein
MWLAVPEDDNGMWWGDPLSADTYDEIRKLASEQWTHKLPEDIDVMLYCCQAIEVLELPKEDEAEPEKPDRCPHTGDMFGGEGG